MSEVIGLVHAIWTFGFLVWLVGLVGDSLIVQDIGLYIEFFALGGMWL